jgi:3-oxoacyl-[acyl-carrier protein] reductase
MRLSELTLAGKACIVTGGGSGIGRAIALALARSGGAVCVADRDEEAACRVTDELREAGGADGKGIAVRADVTRASEVDAMVKAAMEGFGRVDVLVNNAGGAAGTDLAIGRVHQVAERDWDRSFELNLKTVYLCTRAVAPGMLKQGSGSIVNMASVTGRFPFPGMPAYSAAKAGVISLTKSSAMELAPQVRVNALAPGLIETPRTSKNRRPEQLRQLLSNVPLGRMGTPEDVADLAVYLASDAAAYISGTVIDVGGGQCWMTEDGRPAFRDTSR